jgi:hypothetical protein
LNDDAIRRPSQAANAPPCASSRLMTAARAAWPALPEEQAGLRREASLHGLRVSGGEPREGGDAEIHPGHALLLQTGRADLQHGLPAAGIAHLGEQTVKIQRFGRGAVGRHGAGAEIVMDAADEAHALRRTRQQVLHEAGDGGLAVAPAHGDEIKGLVRKPEVALRDLRQRAAHIGHLEVGDAQGGAGGHFLADDGDRAALDGLGDVGLPVRPATRHREE